jgi:RHS repeat-associated protein
MTDGFSVDYGALGETDIVRFGRPVTREDPWNLTRRAEYAVGLPDAAADCSAAGDGSPGACADRAASGLCEAARDAAVAARSPADIPQAGDPVDVATGDVLLFQDDVWLPGGIGVLPLIVSRAYRSSQRTGRWFGPAWASTFDQRLHVSPDRVVGVFADGRVLSWRCEAGADGPVPVTGLPVAGPRWRLRRVPAGGLEVTDPQAGLTWRFEWRPGYGRPASGAGEMPVVAVADRAGHQVSLGYTQSGQPAWIAHSGGYRIRVLTEGGRLSGLVLASASENDAADGALLHDGVPLVEYRYDPAGNLAAIINSSGQASRFRYDEDGRLLGWEDRNGVSYQYTYDEQGRCVAGAGPDGALSGRFTYGDGVTWWADAAGAVTIYQLDEAGQVVAVTDPLGRVTHLWHDEDGREVARADPLGRLTRHDYDERGNLTCVTRPDGSQVRAVFDEANLPVRLEEPDGSCWEQEYDARSNLVRQTAPDGAVTRYGYDEHGHLASVTGPLGAVTRVEANPAGLPVAMTSPGGGITRYARDAFGRVTVITGPDGGVTELTWTTEGQLDSRTFPASGTERLGYDAEGNLLARMSPAGEQTSYEYGPFDVVTAMTEPDGSRTEFGYDSVLHLTAVTHAGLTWRYSYDAAGQLVAETDYNGARTEYSYDAAGQLSGRVNAAGQPVAYAYDELGHLIKREAGGVVTTFGYDTAGRLIQAGNPDAQIRLSRDPRGRVTAETCNDRTVTSEYDGAGRRSRRITPGGSRQRWEYDEAGHPVLLETSGHMVRFGYDQAGRETRRDLPGGLTLTQGWDAAGQLTSQMLRKAPGDGTAAMTAAPWVPAAQRSGASAAQRSGAPAPAPAPASAPGGRLLLRRGYSYRADGFLTGINDLIAGPRRFTLDTTGRITSVTGPGWAEQYSYDRAGSVSSARWIVPPPDVPDTWLAADVQGPRARAGTLITAAGAVRYRHDQQGRVIQRHRAELGDEPATWTYQWDADDRLTAVTTPDGGTWRYRYDPLGRRIAKQRLDPSGALAQETTFTWDGAILAEEATRRSARHSRMSWDYVTWDYYPDSFTPVAQSDRAFADGESAGGIDERFYSIVTDQLGTPAELVSADGAVAGIQQHTLWGGTLWHPGGARTPLRFPGQYHDQETGLHYNQQRYYDPVTGGYLTPDPLGLAAAPNPHAYVPNPHLQADPLGLMSCSQPGVSAETASSSGRAALDTNVLIRGLDKSELGAVDKVLAGRLPVVSPTAASEYLVRGSPELLGEFIRLRGGAIGEAGTAQGAAALRAQATCLGRKLGVNDALIAHSAMREGIPLITGDQQLLGFLRAINYRWELF